MDWTLTAHAAQDMPRTGIDIFVGTDKVEKTKDKSKKKKELARDNYE
jgi:hypothetical protein